MDAGIAQGFVVFRWFTENELNAQPDVQAFFVSEWETDVKVKGGTYPRFTEAIEVGPDDLARLGVRPKPNCRLLRLSGYAVAPQGAMVEESEID